MNRYLFWISLLLNVAGALLVWKAVDRLGGLRQVWSLWAYNEVPSLYDHRVSLFKQLPLEKGAVIFLGDSQIEQGEWHELCNAAKGVVLNRGIAGDYIGGVYNRLEEVMRHEPTVIFLEVGINDLFFGTHPQQAAENYAELVRKIRSLQPGVQIVVLSLPPVNDDIRMLASNNNAVTNLNEELARIARNHALPFVDLYTPLSDKQGKLSKVFTSDGVHLNGGGYRVWRDAIEPYLPKE